MSTYLWFNVWTLTNFEYIIVWSEFMRNLFYLSGTENTLKILSIYENYLRHMYEHEDKWSIKT